MVVDGRDEPSTVKTFKCESSLCGERKKRLKSIFLNYPEFDYPRVPSVPYLWLQGEARVM